MCARTRTHTQYVYTQHNPVLTGKELGKGRTVSRAKWSSIPQMIRTNTAYHGHQIVTYPAEYRVDSEYKYNWIVEACKLNLRVSAQFMLKLLRISPIPSLHHENLKSYKNNVIYKN